jgi:hypothetical protein
VKIKKIAERVEVAQLLRHLRQPIVAEIQHAQPGRIVAFASTLPDGPIVVSRDAGCTWTRSASPALANSTIWNFAVHPADPELVYWTQSGQLVFMAVLGGFANFFGPIVGALSYILLQDQLQSLTQYWRFVLGAILALIVIAFPQGIAGLAVQLKRLVAGRPA